MGHVMVKRILFALLFGLMAFTASHARAGTAEEAVVVECMPTASTVAGYVGCVAGGWSGQAAQTCLMTPSKCWGGEAKKLLCAIGVGGGCHPPDGLTELVRVLPYRGGCLAIYESGTYFSPDCKNLRGGGKTLNVWPGHFHDIRAMIIFDGCITTAFSGGGIYRSCDGYNLGGGGDTTKLYEGTPVHSMDVVSYQNHYVVRIIYDGHSGTYCDPSGWRPAGGPGVDHCDRGPVNHVQIPG